jgi:L-phenylalanine/L-methionine N-acetyltransferase
MDRPTIQIRAWEPDDIPQLTEVLNQPRVIWGTLQVPFTSIASRRKRAETRGPAFQLVAVVDDRVVGVISLDRFERRRAHAATIGMAVHDAYAGRGCGRALLSAAIEQADRWLNIKRLELAVWADNDRAIALYEAFGFEREGLCRAYGWRDGAYADSIAMARLKVDEFGVAHSSSAAAAPTPHEPRD